MPLIVLKYLRIKKQAIISLFSSIARCKRVCWQPPGPGDLPQQFTSQPFSTKIDAISSRPASNANQINGFPSDAIEFGSAPYRHKALTTAGKSASIANSNGIFPFGVFAFGSALFSIKNNEFSTSRESMALQIKILDPKIWIYFKFHGLHLFLIFFSFNFKNFWAPNQK